jgi:flagellar assembly protein FliH
MTLRIIKKETASTTEIQPYFLQHERQQNGPELYILPEATPIKVVEPGSDDGETLQPIEEAPSFSTEEVEQFKKEAFDQGRAEGHEAGHAEGHAEGLAEGLKTGEESAAAQIEEMTKAYAESMTAVAMFKDTLRAQVEDEVVRLALTVAKKIVHREIQIDRTIIHTLVRVALGRVSGKSAVVIRLSPVDYEYMVREREDLAKEEGREITFESDNILTQGSCLIQTETGDIDARIEEEFHEVESLFFEG